LRVGLAVGFAVAGLTAAGCSSSDTTLALTITSGEGVVQVSHIRVVITPASGSEITKELVPPTTDGAIVTSFFERLSLPESADGPANVRVDALNASGASYAWGTTTAQIEKNHAVAAQVKLTVGGPPAGDGGVGGASGGGAGGAAGSPGSAGAGGAGATGGIGGAGGVRGLGGSSGGAGGAGGRRGGGNNRDASAG
jgi:hypothetical protein